MKIIFSCIGKIKKSPQQDLFEVYQKRLNSKISVHEFDTKPTLNKSQRKLHEATLLLSPFKDNSRYIIALDERGKEMSSQDFAKCLDQVHLESYKTLGIIIGGADGLASSVLNHANLSLSLGRMTWPHMTVRALMAEQLYRAYAILAGHPYHRD